MAITLNPPPLQVPAEFGSKKEIASFFNGLLNTIYQLWTTVYGMQTKVTVKTIDASLTGLLRVKVPEGKTVMISGAIVARRTGGSAGTVGDSAWYRLDGAYKNISGVLSGVGSPNLYGGEDQAGWNVGFSTSGQEAVVVVTGAANNDITWEGTLSTYTVGA